MEVAIKECEEISHIFAAYDIHIDKIAVQYVPYKEKVKASESTSAVTTGMIRSPAEMEPSLDEAVKSPEQIINLRSEKVLNEEGEQL